VKVPYLRSKNEDKNTGEIEVVIVHCPYNEVIGEIEPQIVDGFVVEVELPYFGETFGINNVIYSPAAASYLRGQWLGKMPLHVRTLVSTLEKTHGMSLPSNNQGIEGMTDKEKNKTRDFRINTSEPGPYFWYRYLDLINGSKYMVAEIDRCEGYIERRRERKNRIEARENAEDLGVERTEDATELQEENNQDMIFDRTGVNAWMDKEEVVRRALESVFVSNGLDKKSLAKRWEAVDAHAGRGENNESLIVSKPTFDKWIKRARTGKLSSDVVGRMKDYINAHGGNVQG